MKIFFDMEFTGLHQNTTPISIGMVAEQGSGFYAEFIDYNRVYVDEWLQDNVIDNLIYKRHENWYYTQGAYTSLTGDVTFVADAIKNWLWSFDEDIEMWGDCLAYDWVLFCQLYGGALTMIDRVLYIPMDICTMMKVKGIDPDVNREEFSEIVRDYDGMKHNAFWDAKVIKACYEKLESLNSNDKIIFEDYFWEI